VSPISVPGESGDLAVKEIGPMSTPTLPKVTAPRPRTQRKYGLLVWATVAFVSTAILASTYLLFVEPPPPRKVIIASGSKNGAYYQFAQKYAERLKMQGLTLEVRETAGSVENLKLLEDDSSGVTLGVIQSGVAGPEERERCYALGSLFREPLWVFYRGARIDRLSSWRENGSASARRAAAPTQLPCGCSPSTAWWTLPVPRGVPR
jgi:hypothetical protein